MESEFEKRLLGSPVNSPAKGLYSPSQSPITSPVKDTYGDRYIPTRPHARMALNFNSVSTGPTASKTPKKIGTREISSENANLETYKTLLSHELSENHLNVEDPRDELDERRRRILMPRENRNLFSFHSHRESPNKLKTAPYSLSPISDRSQRILKSPKRQLRRIPKLPYKVLDAPDLLDDFYLNLVDWSSQNVLAVGLGSCVYLWSAYTSQQTGVTSTYVTRLCDLGQEGDNVSSVAWSDKGGYVSVGTHRGQVQVWDVSAHKKLISLNGHSGRVGALAWNGDLLASGSRDRQILLRDHRKSGGPERRLKEHRQEVCGLRWSPDHQHLASGGNDNRLFVWSVNSTQPVQTYADHIAAVKAIAWSPHQHGLLASGGGTADRCVRFWNTLTSQPLSCVDTGSQVCNIAWSKHSAELVTTHGYSQNQILVWRYPSLEQVAKLTGHTCRVLYLAVSPDGESIVTGAGDETLRFWHVFTKSKPLKTTNSQLSLFSGIR